MEVLDHAILTQLKPFFYLIGLLVVSQLGMIIKFLMSKSEKKEDKLELHIDNLTESVNELSRHVIKIETKLDIFVEHSEKDLNNIGQKLRDLNS